MGCTACGVLAAHWDERQPPVGQAGWVGSHTGAGGRGDTPATACIATSTERTANRAGPWPSSTWGRRLSIFDEPKTDCHNHVLDPARFEFSPKAYYRPAGAELGTRSQLTALFEAYGVQRALVIQPNSGYDDDNSCLIDVLTHGEGRFKGMAIVPNDVPRSELERLHALRVAGVTFNAALLGAGYYSNGAALLAELADLDMFVDLQVQADQMVEMRPLLEATDVRIVVDHCGRPRPSAGLDQPGFAALLRLAATGRVFVKASGYAKLSDQPYAAREAPTYRH